MNWNAKAQLIDSAHILGSWTVLVFAVQKIHERTAVLKVLVHYISHFMRKPVLCHMRTTKAHPRSLISTFVVHFLDSIIFTAC